MIVVCPLNAVEAQIARHRASHLVSLLGPEHMIETPASISTERHLRLSLHDISMPMEGYTAPGEEHVMHLVEFIRAWDRGAPMIIHCWAGISRSTAAAFTAQCMLHPGRAELDLAQELRSASPVATPNRLIVASADAILGREGRMCAAIEAIGRGANAWEGNVFSLNMSSE